MGAYLKGEKLEFDKEIRTYNIVADAVGTDITSTEDTYVLIQYGRYISSSTITETHTYTVSVDKQSMRVVDSLQNITSASLKTIDNFDLSKFSFNDPYIMYSNCAYTDTGTQIDYVDVKKVAELGDAQITVALTQSDTEVRLNITMNIGSNYTGGTGTSVRVNSTLGYFLGLLGVVLTYDGKYVVFTSSSAISGYLSSVKQINKSCNTGAFKEFASTKSSTSLPIILGKLVSGDTFEYSNNTSATTIAYFYDNGCFMFGSDGHLAASYAALEITQTLQNRRIENV